MASTYYKLGEPESTHVDTGDKALKRSFHGEFLDQDLERTFKTRFFRQNMTVQMCAYMVFFRPDSLIWSSISSSDTGAKITWVLLLIFAAALIVGRLLLHSLGDQILARRLSMVMFAALISQSWVVDIFVILTGDGDVDTVQSQMRDPAAVAAATLVSLVIGVLQGSHAPSFCFTASCFVIIMLDNLLNGVMLLRKRAFDDVSTLVSWFFAYVVGLAWMHSHQRSQRNEYDMNQQQLHAQEQVAAYLFHEIRNHQHVQSGALGLIIQHGEERPQEPLPPSFHPIICEAYLHASQGTNVITNMMNYTKIRAGKLSPTQEPFDLVELLNESASLVQHMARQKALVKFLVQADLGAKSVMCTGPVQIIKQVLVNLLTNSIKYTSSGSVTLRASVLEQQIAVDSSPAQTKQRILFSVEDTGCGIRPEKRATLFEPFAQGDRPGTGLGLPFCKEVLGLLSSHLDFSVSASGGSIFSFVLTCDAILAGWIAIPASASPTSIAAPTKLPGHAQGKGRVLIADDSKVNRLLLRLLVEEAFPDTRIVEESTSVGTLQTLTEALTSGNAFSLVFVDDCFDNDDGNELDGLQITRRYRQIEAQTMRQDGHLIPAILVGYTAKGGVMGYEDEAKSAGQDHVMSKPLPHKEDFVSEIMSLCTHRAR